MKDWLERHITFIFILPIMLFILGMVVSPLIYTFYLGFTEWSMGVTPPRFIGLENYKVLLQDMRFWGALGRTLYLAFGSVLIEIVLGLALAMLLHREFMGKNLAKTLFLLPMIATPVALGMVWLLIYEPTLGVANYLLKKLGLEPVLWLVNQKAVLNSLILIEVWEWTPMVMLIILAGLTALPSDPYESAIVDGAGKWQIFTRITLPLIVPTVVIAALLRLIDSLKTFDIIYSMTQGGPLYASETLNILTYTLTFGYLRMGNGSALVMLFLVVIGMASSLVILIRRRVERIY
jgi:multiple sugar transport system permease protein